MKYWGKKNYNTVSRYHHLLKKNRIPGSAEGLHPAQDETASAATTIERTRIHTFPSFSSFLSFPHSLSLASPRLALPPYLTPPSLPPSLTFLLFSSIPPRAPPSSPPFPPLHPLPFRSPCVYALIVVPSSPLLSHWLYALSLPKSYNRAMHHTRRSCPTHMSNKVMLIAQLHSPHQGSRSQHLQYLLSTLPPRAYDTEMPRAVRSLFITVV